MDDGERDAFRRALGRTLYESRRKLTKYSSQQSIAAVLKVDKGTVGRWERGAGEPQVSELVVLWRHYKIPAEWLLNPTADVNELNRWIAGLRRERLTRAAEEAGEDDAADEPGPPSGGDT